VGDGTPFEQPPLVLQHTTAVKLKVTNSHFGLEATIDLKRIIILFKSMEATPGSFGFSFIFSPSSAEPLWLPLQVLLRSKMPNSR